jgi:CBASS immunity sensor of nucleotide second messenger signals
MPLLMTLGCALSNKVPTDFFQCHRDGADRWTWHEEGPPTRYVTRRVRQGLDRHRVALVLPLSGAIDPASLPAAIDNSFTIYEIALADQIGNTGFLRQRQDLEHFRAAYRELLARLRSDHAGLPALRLFPAVPAPVAIVCGFDLLPKVDPALVVYDNVMKDGGFIQRLKVNDHERQ